MMLVQKGMLSLAIGLVLSVMACNTDEKAQEQNSEQVETKPKAESMSPQEPVMPSNEAATTQSPAAPVKEAVALNPAHGQPGHDCAVAVGAPLPQGSANAQAAAPTVSMPVGTNPFGTAVPAANYSIANRNPAHGQPGHDCAVAVGAPLPVQ